MNRATQSRRPYDTRNRESAASATRGRILDSARDLFQARGIDPVTIAEIARTAGVSASSVYSSFKSKEGLLRALMERALFGGRYQAATVRLGEDLDPVRRLPATASVARSIYEAEAVELGFMRGISGLSPALREVERAFEEMRFELQRERVEELFASGWARPGLSLQEARRILWMYTSRDIYRLLVGEGGWTPDRYEEWLSGTLVAALTRPEPRPGASLEAAA